MKSNKIGLRGFSVITVFLACLALQAVFTLPAYSDEIVGWGNNFDGEATPPPGNDFTDIAAGGAFSLALKADGSIVGWGRNDYGQMMLPPGNDFTAIAAGADHCLALKSDGSIVCWGRNTGTPPPGNDFTAIAAGYYFNLALKSDGSIIGWGSNTWGESMPPPGNNFTAIDAGYHHGVALKSDGSIVCWGGNYFGQTEAPAGNDFTAVEAYNAYCLALKSDGSIVGWGQNNCGQATPPAGNDFTAITAGYYDALALKSDGSIVVWGLNFGGLSTPPAGNNFTAIAAGSQHFLALMSVLQNSPPVADASGPYLVEAGQTITLNGSGSYDDDGDTLSYLWTQSDILGSFDNPSLENPDYTGSQAGITDLTLTVSDGKANDSDTTLLVVYDPSGGFVTGGGWIYSQPGDYVPNPTLEGKANFGFVSKYEKGATVPTGNTEFQFKTGDLNFHSSNYDWLVVTGSNYAKFKGTGTINGSGAYKFMLWAGDDMPDTFRIRIWEEDESGVETDVYDNGFDQAIGGGSIVIHTK